MVFHTAENVIQEFVFVWFVDGWCEIFPISAYKNVDLNSIAKEKQNLLNNDLGKEFNHI